MPIIFKTIWIAALAALFAAMLWFIFAPTTNFLSEFGTEQEIGMIFVFTFMPSVLFLFVSLAQLIKGWYQSFGKTQFFWLIATVVYSLGLISAHYFRFLA